MTTDPLNAVNTGDFCLFAIFVPAVHQLPKDQPGAQASLVRQLDDRGASGSGWTGCRASVGVEWRGETGRKQAAWPLGRLG